MIGAGVVGCATALSLARRGPTVALLEAEPEPGLGASGTNSGILHTGFESTPGELETELILATAQIRDEVLDSLGVPLMRCGARMLLADESERATIAELAVNARHNGVAVSLGSDGSLEIPGEAVTDPVTYTLALAGAATGQGVDLRTGWNAVAVECNPGGLTVRNSARTASGSSRSCCRCRRSGPRACSCFRRSTASSWPGRPRSTSRTSTTGQSRRRPDSRPDAAPAASRRRRRRDPARRDRRDSGRRRSARGCRRGGVGINARNRGADQRRRRDRADPRSRLARQGSRAMALVRRARAGAVTRPAGAQDERPNNRRNSRNTLRTSRKIPAAIGIASSVPARRRRLKSTTV